MDNISKIFNSKDQEEIKQSFKEILIEKFKYEVDSFDDWFFDKDAIDELAAECYREVLEEVRVDMKQILKDKMLDNIKITISQKVSKK